MKNLDQKYINKLLNRWEELEQKYFKLVWFARKPLFEDDPNFYHGKTKEKKEIIRKCMDGIKDVMQKYPEEVKDLGSPEEGDWCHGFNSGCLASFRHVLTSLLDEDGLEQADDDFPFLDT